jgi:adenylate kinase
MNIVLLGPPGSGKGTVGAALSRKLGMAEFDAGSHLREWASGAGEEQRALKGALDAGEFAPTPLVMRIYREWVAGAMGAGRKVLSSGIPRGDQADIFIADLEAGHYPCNGLIWLDAPVGVLIQRLVGRRTCGDCNTIYHVDFAPPAKDGCCDACGGSLTVRGEDSSPAATRRRIELYQERTLPVRERLAAAGVPVQGIDAARSSSAVIASAEAAVTGFRRSLVRGRPAVR